jgi:hypothetical protein
MLYAAYGSNLHPLRLRERVPLARFLGSSWLDGWSLNFHKRSVDGSAKCNIVPGGSGVAIAIYELQPGCKHTLDGIEGVGQGYHCEQLDAPGFGPCFAYIAADSHIDRSLQPYDWYVQLVVLGCKRLGLPASYIASIQEIITTIDPDPERRRVNRIMVEKLKMGGRIAGPGK